ncbi:MAG: hypothetical protein JRI97_10725 [Deltaproteobacteria bacterium]|nr:hypothetical protein [Deltaproteobacteria bacterium]
MDILKIDYEPPPGLPRALGRKVRMGEVSDERGGDPCLLMEKNVGGGLPAGAYAADRPVAGIVKDALSAALSASGLLAGEGEDKNAPVLSAQVTACGFGVMVGFSRCMLRGRVAARVRIEDPPTGKTLFDREVEGHGGAGAGSLVQQALCAALDDFLRKLFQSPGFAASRD